MLDKDNNNWLTNTMNFFRKMPFFQSSAGQTFLIMQFLPAVYLVLGLVHATQGLEIKYPFIMAATTEAFIYAVCLVLYRLEVRTR